MSTNPEHLIAVEQMPPAGVATPSRLESALQVGKHIAARAAFVVGTVSGLLAAETVALDAPVAMAATGGYPDAGAPCVANNQGKTEGIGYWCTGYQWGYYTRDGQGNITGNVQNSSRGYGYRNCTDWVAFRIPQLVQKSVPWGWSHAKNWDEKAVAAGYTVDTTPEPGDIAVWNGGTYGHVEVVEAVNANGTVKTSGYNQKEDGNYQPRDNITAEKYIDLNGTGKGINGEDLTTGGGNASPAPLIDPVPAMLQRATETVMVVVAPDKTLDYHFNPGGGGTWTRLDIPNADAKSTPAAVLRPSGELNVAAQGDDGSLDFYINQPGSNTWGKMEVAGPNSAYSAPSIIQRSSGETNIVVQGPNNTLDYYYNFQGDPQWYKVTVPDGQAYSRPAVVQRPNGETNIAVLGSGNSMNFHWNMPGSPTWGKVPVAVGGTAMGAPSMVQRPTTGETIIAVQGPNHTLDLYLNNAGSPLFGHHRAVSENSTFNDNNPPAMLLRPDGELDIAVHGPGNTASVYYNAQGQQEWGQTMAAAPGYAFKEPVMIQRVTGETNLVIVGPSNRLDYYMNSQGSGQWDVLPISGNNSAY